MYVFYTQERKRYKLSFYLNYFYNQFSFRIFINIYRHIVNLSSVKDYSINKYLHTKQKKKENKS